MTIAPVKSSINMKIINAILSLLKFKILLPIRMINMESVVSIPKIGRIDLDDVFFLAL